MSVARSLLHRISKTRVSFRTYASTTAYYKRPTTTSTKPSVNKSVSTTPGAGDPDIVSTLPDTSKEIDVESEALAALSTSAPPESVPSSSTLRTSSSPPSSVPQPPSNSSPFDAESTQGSDDAGGKPTTDWSRSYHGLSVQPFPKDMADILMAPVDPMDVEMKPDGMIYLPEIKYRRILNKAFGPGGWGLAPRSETNVGPKVVSREYALVCLGRLVAVARGEQEYFDPSGVPTATEACKSNALMRCCKDLGIASELWDPRFIREFKAKHCVEVFAEHSLTKKKKKLWRRKDQPKFDYPFKE